ncbi:MAG TPA: AAC(3) family N-acetyltransferase [Rhodobacterales bacterium]|nr:AAC(3) family N-acetyltransferase [Rhodobacterales bacterium]
MAEADLICAQEHPISQADLRDALTQTGIKSGDVVLMHVSMRRVGWVIGGVQGLLQAVLDHLGTDLDTGGTLVMPAFSSQLSDPGEWQSPPVPPAWVQPIRDAMPLFDPALTPTRGMGSVAEALRALPATKRSMHVRDSFMAVGPLAGGLLADHPLSGSLGQHSPLGKLYRAKAKVLLLGAGFDSCTAFHLAEDGLPGIAPVCESYPVARVSGVTQWQTYTQPANFERFFPQIGGELASTCAVRSALGGAAQVFDMPAGVDFARTWLERAARAGKLTQ